MDKAEYKNLVDRLRRLICMELDITQVQAAKRIGVSRPTLSKVWRYDGCDLYQPSIRTIERIKAFVEKDEK